ncbi:hypothetical protein BC832DRAFT_108025 [Gaertneriomyces semiglobifer]|nr:hypothetical protein BC832DRAFT_108025 [Gaertneriomyces semiglobifer]
MASKYRNVYSTQHPKPLYSGLKVDQTVSVRIKVNKSYIALPVSNGLGVFPIPLAPTNTPRRGGVAPLVLGHPSQLQTYCFSPSGSLLSTAVRGDGIVRVWHLQDDAIGEFVEGESTTVDSASIYLASHEKRVDSLAWLSCVSGVLASGASDGIRVWDVGTSQERIAISTEDSCGSIGSLTWDYTGDGLAGACGDGGLRIWDVRKPGANVQEVITPHVASKPIQALWLPPNPLIVTSGFTKGGHRELAVYDVRTGLSTPLTVISVKESSPSPLTLLWDTALPLLYAYSKSEGIRLYEVSYSNIQDCRTGSPPLNVGRSTSAVDLLPKSVCEWSKNEVARFLALGENLECASVYVPRREEGVWQGDLYPAVPNPCEAESDINKWWKGAKVLPVMKDAIVKSHPGTVLLEQREITFNPNKAPDEDVIGALSRTGTVLSRTTTTVAKSGTKLGSVSRNPTTISRGSVKGLSHGATIQPQPTPQFLSSQVELEYRGWFYNSYSPHVLSLHRKHVYLFASLDDETPMHAILLASIKKVEPFTIGVDRGDGSADVGFQLEAERVWRFKAATKIERDMWIAELGKSIKLVKEKAQAMLPPLPKPPSMADALPTSTVPVKSLIIGNRDGSLLIGQLESYNVTNRTWSGGLHVLDELGYIHRYESLPQYLFTTSAPSKTIQLNSVLACRADSESPETFVLNTPKRAIWFRAKDAKEADGWVEQIRAVVPAAVGKDDVIEGAVTIKPDVMDLLNVGMDAGTYYLTIINEEFYYFNAKRGRLNAVLRGMAALTVMDTEDAKEEGSIRATLAFLTPHVTVLHVMPSSWLETLQKLRLKAFPVIEALSITEEAFFTNVSKAFKNRDDWGAFLAQVHSADDSSGKSSPLLEGIEIIDDKNLQMKSLIRVSAASTEYVPPMTSTITDDGYAFVLDVGTKIFHHPTPSAPHVIRAVALDIATQLRKMRSNRPRVMLVDHTTDCLPEFRSYLEKVEGKAEDGSGVSGWFRRGSSPTATTVPIIRGPNERKMLYKVVDAERWDKRVRLIGEQTLSRNLLDSDGVYILECAWEIFTWFGNKSTREDRAIGTVVASELARRLQSSIKGWWKVYLRRELEGQEGVVWKAKIGDYESTLPISMSLEGNVPKSLVADSSQIQRPTFTAELLTACSLPADPIPPKSVAVRTELFLIDGFELCPLSYSTDFVFSSSCSYIITHFYRPPQSGIEKCLAFFWQGSESSIVEKGTSAMLAVEVGKKCGVEVGLERVVEGKEPQGFVALFGGIKVKRVRGTQRDAEPAAWDVREISDGMVRAVQLGEEEIPTVILHTVSTPAGTFLGPLSTKAELAFAGSLTRNASTINVLPTTLKSPAYDALSPSSQPKLFHISPTAIHPIASPTQQDLYLNPGHTFILDVGDTLWVWLGEGVAVKEKLMALELCLEYVNKREETLQVRSKTPNTLVTSIYREPNTFTSHFQAWSTHLPIYKAKSERVTVPKAKPLDVVLAKLKTSTYDIETLKTRPPEGVDVTKLEKYLNDADFTTVFGMQRPEFERMPSWQRTDLKKKVGMF